MLGMEDENSYAKLIIAYKELAYQNEEKEKRAAELLIANKELAFQNEEKEKRAAELVIANKELAFQNQEKEKRAIELMIANKELESFTFISNHDLQEPLRKIQTFSKRILMEESEDLSERASYYFERIQHSASHMQTLINDLLDYSRMTAAERKFEFSDLSKIVKEVVSALQDELQKKEAIVEFGKLSEVNIIPFQFRQLMQTLITNSLKFSKTELPPHIIIKSEKVTSETSRDKALRRKVDYCHITVSDNGLGFDPKYKDKIFDIFQRLHDKENYEGTGIGLTIARKIVENHQGIITASGEIGKGSTFNIFIPIQQF
ncbi:MAG: two-component sensor histidine kinase [Flavobacterium sp. BFFFF1]|nr:MAG: two-component sensor histidine kinase [Flavobacterium sp. BFFFF1]